MLMISPNFITHEFTLRHGVTLSCIGLARGRGFVYVDAFAGEQLIHYLGALSKIRHCEPNGMISPRRLKTSQRFSRGERVFLQSELHQFFRMFLSTTFVLKPVWNFNEL